MGFIQWTKWSENFDSGIVGMGIRGEGGHQWVVSPICRSCSELRLLGLPLVFSVSGDRDSMKALHFLPPGEHAGVGSADQV